MHYSTKETQICSPELGVATIRMWAVASPFVTGALVVRLQQVPNFPSNFVLLKALDKLQIWKLPFPNTDCCLCIPKGSGVILDNAPSKRATDVYPTIKHHMIF